MTDSFGSRSRLEVADRSFEIHRLDALAGVTDIGRLPFSLKILLENLLRHEDGAAVRAEDVEALARWGPNVRADREIAFSPARVLMQDFTGVPAVVDLAAMRDAIAGLDGDAARINPLLPVDLVIDHSIIAEVARQPQAFQRNAEIEFERNRERYVFLRWGQQAFENFRVVPPNTGIVHQVNLEHLASVITARRVDGRGNRVDGRGDNLFEAFPDTLVGTDSHTPMVNGLGVLGWGVGGIEAEAAMLGQPLSMLIPHVVGFRLEGELPEGATATDLVLTVTEMLRRHGVVGKFVEFYGEGVTRVPLANRATIGNMSPEYGSTCTMFPIDEETLRYLRLTGRSPDQVTLVEAYAKEQGLWHDPAADPRYSERLGLDLSTVEPCIAGPSRPQDRVPLRQAKAVFRAALADHVPEQAGPPGRRRQPGVPSNVLPPHLRETTPDEASALSFPSSDPPARRTGDEARPDSSSKGAVLRGGSPPTGLHAAPEIVRDELVVDRPRRPVPVELSDGTHFTLDHGHVVIAAITSCTNTSNPQVMLAAGLLARKAVSYGLITQPWVKTSLAPGSQVVMDYYERSGLLPYLEKLGFYLVGYGCTTCIGNSGSLAPEISAAIARGGLSVCSVLSGNRNFEGRINPDVRMNYLASPPLVVAYALAGSMDLDLVREPLGYLPSGEPVELRHLWPSTEEVEAVMREAIHPEMFSRRYSDVFHGDERWRSLGTPPGQRFTWEPSSTYVRRPPFFEGMGREPRPPRDVLGARALALLGDSVTTDHISPAGVISSSSPAGRYLMEQGVEPVDFNSYGARRGNHEVMLRGTFANIRLRNRLVPGVEGGYTVHLPDGEQLTIYEAAMRYRAEGVPLVVLAGKEYGSGSSRDWAAKGTALLGVRAVIAASFERIHRSNLVGMGVLPLQFQPGDSVEALGLTGHETYDVRGIADVEPGATLSVHADGRSFEVLARVETPMEAAYLKHGGILRYVLRQLLG
ncbi:MAG: aconitate hydratase [Nitriliruptorales bacterium]